MTNGVVAEEDGYKFVIVPVKYQIIRNKPEAEKAREKLSIEYPGMPIILMAMGVNGIPEYYGQEEIINCLKNNPALSPWKLYKLK
jgi:hypothetical protein